MALVAKGGGSFSVRRALLWSVSWGAGAAIGVALGGWLTLVGGAGAPGAEALDPRIDLILLPLAAFFGVSVIHLGGQMVLAAVRGGRADHHGDDHDEEPQTGDDEVDG